MTGGPGILVWLPEGKEVSHGQARVPVLLSGKGKGRKKRNRRLGGPQGAGHPYLPGTALTGASCPNSCKIFPPALPPRGVPLPVQGCIRALCKGWLRGRVVAGAKKEQGKADFGSKPYAIFDWTLAAPPWPWASSAFKRRLWSFFEVSVISLGSHPLLKP